jgi:glycosyltransferase involved in cell wall biosynthesis
MKFVTAIPIYNEDRHIEAVLDEVRRYSPHILVVNDGSTDRSGELLARQSDITVITHPENRGYGAALASAFRHAVDSDFDVLVTMDCDGQHEPSRIAVLLEAIHDADIVSGSRYLREFRENSGPAPAERMHINRSITRELNDLLGLNLTDAFCGFKAYRRCALGRLHVTEPGWGMPLQLWVQAARLCLRVKEIGVPRLYIDPNRSFGADFDDADKRLAYYRRVISDALVANLPSCALPLECFGRLAPEGCR